MTDPEMLPSDIHDEVALLPWYANGTLTGPERRRVMQHLESCTSCRTELDEISHLKSELATIYRSQPGPSKTLTQTVMHAVAQDASRQQAGRHEQRSWIYGIDHWLRTLFLPRWVPTLASLLLIAQAGLLLWLVVPQSQQEPVSTRSLAMQTATIRVVFQPNATEQDIRSLLETIRGRVVDGPNQDGSYLVEVLAADNAAALNKLKMLRTQTAIIVSADAITP